MDREFKGVWIPREVWLDERLNALDKIILVEIDSLDNGDDHCYAGNEYLAEFCQCSESKVTKTIAKLIDLGYVKVHSFDGRVRKLRSCLTFCTALPSNFSDSAQQNERVNNIPNNQKNKHTTRKRAESVNLSAFDDFWAIYPKKDAKQAAIKAWMKLKPNDDLKNAIIAGVRRDIDGKWKGAERRYIPNPATYLNGGRWEDEATTDTVDDEYYPTYREYHEGDEFIEPEGCTPVGGCR